MKITIPGKPIPKMRPRFARRGSFVATYDAQQKEKEKVKKIISAQLLENLNSDNKFTSFEAGKICRSNIFFVEFIFFLPINQSDSVSVQNKKLWGVLCASSKPDYDNLEKFYLDCANGILWTDDASIIKASALKVYSEEPRVEIVVKAKDDSNLMPSVEKVITSFAPSEFKEMQKYAKEISLISQPAMGDIEGDILQEWIISTACLLSDFALKYAGKLSKIAKLGCLTDEVKKREEFREELKKGVYNI
jgi:Holliday junction resolvase RusA-like endonuclease